MWKDLAGYEQYFQISDAGEVWSKRRNRLIKTPVNKYRGYKEWCSTIDGKNKTFAVHQEVARTFLGPLPDGQCVRHINGDRTDNRLENLTYGSMLENVADRRGDGYLGVPLLTHDQIEWAKSKILDGWSILECAKSLEVSYETIAKYLDVRPKQVREQMIFSALQTGATVTAIAQAFDITHGAVCSYLKRVHNTSIREIRKKYALNKNITPAQLRIIMGLEK